MIIKSAAAGLIALALVSAPAFAQQAKSSLPSSDKKFVTEAAEGGQMEVDLGELAQQEAASDAVREFGRRMADHGKANRELAQLAASKQVQLSDKPSRRRSARRTSWRSCPAPPSTAST